MFERGLAIFAFIAILVIKLERLDIAVIAAITLALAGWDVLGRKKS